MIHIIATRPSTAALTRPLSPVLNVRQPVGQPTRPLTPASRTGGTPLARRVPHSPARRRPLHPWLIFFAVLLTPLAGMLNLTLLNAALPQLSHQFQLPLSTVSWLTTGYTLTFVLFPLIAGRMADQTGRKRLFLLTLALFGAGALLCACAPSFGALLAGRVLQALGASAFGAVGLALVTQTFARRSRTVAIGLWGAFASLAVGGGPVLGGLLIEAVGWRVLFLGHLPLCLLCAALTWLVVPADHAPRSRVRIALPGMLTFALFLLCLLFALSAGPILGWTSQPIVGAAGGGLSSLLLLFVIERRAVEPLLPRSLFSSWRLLAAVGAVLLLAVAFQGMTLLMPLALVILWHLSQGQAASLMGPLPLVAFVVTALSSGIAPRAATIKGVLGTLLVIVGLALLALLPSPVHPQDLLLGGLLISVGVGLSFSALAVLALTLVADTQLATASGLLNTCRFLGYALGSALLMSLLTRQMPTVPTPHPAPSQLLGAFSTTWGVTLLFPLVAVGLLLLLLHARLATISAFVPGASWQRCYWFSGSGQMSAESITQFLHLHPGWEPVMLPAWARTAILPSENRSQVWLLAS